MKHSTRTTLWGAALIAAAAAAWAVSTSEAHLAQDEEDVRITARLTDHNQFFGSSMRAGDLNGDGIDDLAIDAPRQFRPGIGTTGAIFVFFGRANWPSDIRLDLEQADVEIFGSVAAPAALADGAIGDLDGDGLADLAFVRGATVSVLHGRATWPGVLDLAAQPPDSEIAIAAAGGEVIRAGDLTGDGIDDLVVAQPEATVAGRGRAGTIDVIAGGSRLPAVVDLSTSAFLHLIGPALATGENARLGQSIVVGDLNQDGRGDLLALGTFPHPDHNQSFKTLVALWGGAWSGNVDLAVAQPNFLMRGAPTGFIYGVADIDGNGTNDLLLQADYYRTRVFFGRSWPAVIDMVFSPIPTDLSVLAGPGVRLLGDWDEDGVTDLLVGNVWGPDPSQTGGPGEFHLLRGRPGLSGELTLGAGVSDLLVHADTRLNLPLSLFGHYQTFGTYAALGDFNGDGVPDVASSADNLLQMSASGSTRWGNGQVYLLFGQAPVSTLSAAADTYLRSGHPNKNQGDEEILRVRASGHNRALVRFDQAAIAAVAGSRALASATLRLYIAENAENWGASGRPVAVHRMTSAWTELGATWNSPDDQDASNSRVDGDSWEMGGNNSAVWPFAALPTATALHTNTLAGWVTWDVTADVATWLSGSTENHGWLVKKVEEGLSGRVEYASREAAANGPELVLVFE